MLDDIATATSSVSRHPVRHPPGPDRRPVRRDADREGGRRASRQAARRSQRLGSRAFLEGVLRPSRRRRRTGLLDARDTPACSGRAPRRQRRAALEPPTASVTSTIARSIVVDGRVGWVGGAGIDDHFEDGRFHDLFVRLEGPIAAQLQLVFLASLRWLAGTVPADELDALFPTLDDGAIPCVDAAQRAGPLPADHGCDRHPARRSARRRSTSSTRTSPIGG